MEHPIPHSPNGAGHEQSEVSPRLIIVSLAFLAVGTLLCLALAVGVFRYFKAVNAPPATAVQVQPQPLPPEPRVEIEPWQQIKGVRAREEHVLHSYAWVDQKQGTVRIPIDRAMDMVAQKGLPSHDYLQDILSGKKPPMPPKQGTPNAPK